MKTYRNLYEKIYDFENLYQAYLNAQKCKRYREEVLSFTAHLEENLIEIQNELIYQTYKVGRYREFYVTVPKKRLVMALPFKDRVVQWAIYQVLGLILTKGFISDSYGCIKGRGTHAAIQKLQYWLKLESKQKPLYFLKLDVAKFFYRVDHNVLTDILSKKIDDPSLMWLLKAIINSEDTPFGIPENSELGDPGQRYYNVGIPIGNLTSQLFANAYLNELDQYAKRKMHIKRYIRYMDDVIILSHSKEQLHQYKVEIENYLNNRLLLSLNSKTAIRPCTLGIDFCGYKIWKDHIKLRKSTSLRMKRRLKITKKLYSQGKVPLEKANELLTSYMGLMAHCSSYRLKKKILENYILVRKD